MAWLIEVEKKCVSLFRKRQSHFETEHIQDKSKFLIIWCRFWYKAQFEIDARRKQSVAHIKVPETQKAMTKRLMPKEWRNLGFTCVREIFEIWNNYPTQDWKCYQYWSRLVGAKRDMIDRQISDNTSDALDKEPW